MCHGDPRGEEEGKNKEVRGDKIYLVNKSVDVYV